MHVEAQKWSLVNDVNLVVNYSSERRIQKLALNSAFEDLTGSNFDYVIITVDDVLFSKNTIEMLINGYNSTPGASIAVGVPSPDPLFIKHRRASRWQLLQSEHLSTLLPDNFPLPDGSLWITTLGFISSFRYDLLNGSIHDDVELSNFISSNNLVAVNARNAKVLKIPAMGFHEFAKQTRRSRYVRANEQLNIFPIKLEVVAAIKSTFKDPVGFLQYCFFRMLMLLKIDRLKRVVNSNWERSGTTIRYDL